MNGCIALTVCIIATIVGFGCESKDSGRNPATTPTPGWKQLSLQQAKPVEPLDIGEPRHTPFDLRPDLRDAYADGFRTGWEIMRKIPHSSSLVVPPNTGSQTRLLAIVWNDGVNDGKWAAHPELEPFPLGPTNAMSIGPLKSPKKTPFDSQVELREAYLAGFAAGWTNVQTGHSQALAYPPDKFATQIKLSNVWYEGFVKGRMSAYEEYREWLSGYKL
jgi:hypothetical protein